jgi:hypothetical protein
MECNPGYTRERDPCAARVDDSLCEWQIGARALRLRVAELSNRMAGPAELRLYGSRWVKTALPDAWAWAIARHQANASSRRREEEPCKNGSPL